MVCGSCGEDNRDGRKFCSKCGSALALPCPQCGVGNEPGDLFCGECGHALSEVAATPIPTGSGRERRFVTVMFCDLVGFTSYSEDKDPEEVRTALSRYFEEAREVVGRYGGTIEKFIGDAVMAVWGAPIAHEDDAERAVRAALELVDNVSTLGRSLGTNLSIRAGVLTGETAVEMNPTGEGFVTGDIVNSASRLQSVAEPGTVLVGESTYLISNRSIAFESIGPLALKGKEGHILAWRPLRVVAGAGGRNRSDMLEPPFVGRTEELRSITTALEGVARDNKPRLISVVGVPGIGKSRLAWELYKWMDGVEEVYHWHQGRCPSYGDGITFWALSEMVRMRARVSEQDDDDTVRTKLAATLDEYRFEQDERAEIENALLVLLGIGASSEVEQRTLFTQWRIFFERLAEADPVIMLLEDIQWADQGLLDFLEHILDWARNSPILIITLARPEIVDARPTWGAGQRNFASMYLEPLADPDIERILLGLVPDMPADALAQIVARAEGVPLYAVETIRNLSDKGQLVRQHDTLTVAGPITDLEIPDNLQSLLASRLDALDPQDRMLVQWSSILGKTFTVEAVTDISGEDLASIRTRLETLVRREIFSFDDDPRSPERGQFGFVQSLLREVAYQTLSRTDRLNMHIAAAEHFQTLGDDLASVVASHYSEAYRLATNERQAEDLRHRAKETLIEAGRRAHALASVNQALSYFVKAADLSDDPAEQAALRLRACETARDAGRIDESIQLGTEAHSYFEANDDATGALLAATSASEALGDAGRWSEAVELLSGTISRPGRTDIAECPAAAVRLSTALYWAGDHDGSLAWADRSLELARRFRDGSSILHAMLVRSSHLLLSHAHTEYLVYLHGIITTAKRMGLDDQGTMAYTNLAFTELDIDPAQAYKDGLEGVQVARAQGNRIYEVAILGNAIEGAIVLGEWRWVDEVVKDLLGDVPLSGSTQGLWYDAIRHGALTVAAYRGDFEDVVDYLDSYRMVEDPQGIVENESSRVRLALAMGQFEKAIAISMKLLDEEWGYSGIRAHHLLVAAAMSEDLDAVKKVRHALDSNWNPGSYHSCLTVGGQAIEAALKGNYEDAERLFDDAASQRRAHGWRFDLALGQLCAARLLRAESEPREKAAEEARSIFGELGASPFVEMLDHVLGGG